ncbi:MAG: 30S ribosomal protein S4 [Chloroflexi bacterium]|nr:30S ribosomal protein S4 [Chloroflexota bacterium]
MARYTDANCRLCRRELSKLYLKGDRCFSAKCPIEKKPQLPGQHTISRRKLSEYAIRLREKQKLRRIYGVLEHQFQRYFTMAVGQRAIPTGTRLLQILEARMDNVVFRSGFAPSRPAARQLVNHGHFTVNGRSTNIPSYSLKPGDRIEAKERSKGLSVLKDGIETVKGRSIPQWLHLTPEAMQVIVQSLPLREQIDVPVQEQLIVEFYSR